jgi:hypothetical protein
MVCHHRVTGRSRKTFLWMPLQMIVPRLLNEAAAREYLGGRNPRSVMPPVKIAGRNCWDRVALDQRLDELFGVTNAPTDVEGSALERWRRNKRLSRDEAEAEALHRKMSEMLEQPPELGLQPKKRR